MTTLDTLITWTDSLPRDAADVITAPTSVPRDLLPADERAALRQHLLDSRVLPTRPDWSASALIAVACVASAPWSEGARGWVLMPDGVIRSCQAIIETLDLWATVAFVMDEARDEVMA